MRVNHRCQKHRLGRLEPANRNRLWQKGLVHYANIRRPAPPFMPEGLDKLSQTPRAQSHRGLDQNGHWQASGATVASGSAKPALRRQPPHQMRQPVQHFQRDFMIAIECDKIEIGTRFQEQIAQQCSHREGQNRIVLAVTL
jgi:hypothetical protein